MSYNKEKTHRITFDVPVPVMKKLLALAGKEDMTIAAFLRKVIRDFIKSL